MENMIFQKVNVDFSNRAASSGRAASGDLVMARAVDRTAEAALTKLESAKPGILRMSQRKQVFSACCFILVLCVLLRKLPMARAVPRTLADGTCRLPNARSSTRKTKQHSLNCRHGELAEAENRRAGREPGLN